MKNSIANTILAISRKKTSRRHKHILPPSQGWQATVPSAVPVHPGFPRICCLVSLRLLRQIFCQISLPPNALSLITYSSLGVPYVNKIQP